MKETRFEELDIGDIFISVSKTKYKKIDAYYGIVISSAICCIKPGDILPFFLNEVVFKVEELIQIFI